MKAIVTLVMENARNVISADIVLAVINAEE